MFREFKRSEGGRQRNRVPHQEPGETGSPPTSKRETIAAGHLRAAHAYILISIPTGTSTIFGAFQAIEALLLDQGERHPHRHKLQRKQKFASEIFIR
jgi:hypothetical protein